MAHSRVTPGPGPSHGSNGSGYSSHTSPGPGPSHSSNPSSGYSSHVSPGPSPSHNSNPASGYSSHVSPGPGRGTPGGYTSVVTAPPSAPVTEYGSYQTFGVGSPTFYAQPYYPGRTEVVEVRRSYDRLASPCCPIV